MKIKRFPLAFHRRAAVACKSSRLFDFDLPESFRFSQMNAGPDHFTVQKTFLVHAQSRCVQACTLAVLNVCLPGHSVVFSTCRQQDRKAVFLLSNFFFLLLTFYSLSVQTVFPSPTCSPNFLDGRSLLVAILIQLGPIWQPTKRGQTFGPPEINQIKLSLDFSGSSFNFVFK